MDWLAVIICLLQMGCSSAEVRQPWGLALMEGQNAHLKCTQNNGHNEMYWYRQKGGKELQLLFYFNNKVLINKGNITDRFTSDQPELDHSSLKISPAQPEDSAVYFCASSYSQHFKVISSSYNNLLISSVCVCEAEEQWLARQQSSQSWVPLMISVWVSGGAGTESVGKMGCSTLSAPFDAPLQTSSVQLLVLLVLFNQVPRA
nr:TRBV5.2 [Sphenodon punctatus]